MSDTINVLLVDDQALLRQALANLLAQNTDLTIIGTASDGHEAIKQVALHRPDVVLLDIEMPNLDGLSATQLITQRFPESKVILLSAHDDNAYLINALRAGAKAYLLKNTLGDELTDTIRKVHKGYGQFGPGILEKMVAGIATAENTASPVVLEEALIEPNPLTEAASAVHQDHPLPIAGVTSPWMIPDSALTSALGRFDEDELLTLIQRLRDHPQSELTLKSYLNQHLVENPTNLAGLYLQGVLARQSWHQPQIAFESLKRGFQAGIQQEMPHETLLLFYREALSLDPVAAFSWLTQTSSPWNARKHLPFLIQEAAMQLGKASPQYRSLLTLYRIRCLKAVLAKHQDINSAFLTPTLEQVSVVSNAI